MQPRRIKLASGEVVDAHDLPDTTVRRPPPMPTAKPIVPAAPVIVAAPRTDQQLLDAILSKANALSAKERDAFTRMREGKHKGTIPFLTHKQRAWAQKVASQLGFTVDDPSEW